MPVPPIPPNHRPKVDEHQDSERFTGDYVRYFDADGKLQPREHLPLTLVIKGTQEEAISAAAEHGVSFVFKKLSEFGEIIGTGSTEHIREIVAWYAEPADMIPGKGYAPGTLLYWTNHPETDQNLLLW